MYLNFRNFKEDIYFNMKSIMLLCDNAFCVTLTTKDKQSFLFQIFTEKLIQITCGHNMDQNQLFPPNSPDFDPFKLHANGNAEGEILLKIIHINRRRKSSVQ